MMRRRAAILLVLAALGGCGGLGGKTFTVYFDQYSSDLDPDAQQAVQAAAAFAKDHPLMPLTIAADTPTPGVRIDTLAQDRSVVVRAALLRKGVDRARIEVLGDEKLLHPDGLTGMPKRRVLIRIGL